MNSVKKCIFLFLLTGGGAGLNSYEGLDAFEYTPYFVHGESLEKKDLDFLAIKQDSPQCIYHIRANNQSSYAIELQMSNVYSKVWPSFCERVPSIAKTLRPGEPWVLYNSYCCDLKNEGAVVMRIKEARDDVTDD